MRQLPRFLVMAGLLLTAASTGVLMAQDAPQPAQQSLLANPVDGLTVNKPGAFPGYTLIAPMNSTSTYLIDMDGCIVNEWKSDYTPALSACLLENGHLLRPGAEREFGSGGAGAGGRIQEFTWEGELVWDYSFGDSKLRPHHEICRLPSGNILVIASDVKSPEEAIAAGRHPDSVRKRLVPDCILEVKPTGKTTGEIVWEWHAWDHLVQEFDKTKPNFGDVSEHPELIDLNFSPGITDRMMNDPQQLARLRSLGYVGAPTKNPAGPSNPPSGARPDETQDGSSKQSVSQQRGPQKPPQTGTNAGKAVDKPAKTRAAGDKAEEDESGGNGPGRPMGGDWMHVNSVAYNAKLDQIMISVHEFSEVWIIDHGTTTAEAASHKGGRRGKGGDLLYRWGNPRVYRSGSNVDQRLFVQHCAHWIEEGLPGAGHLLVFNNGVGRPDGDFSSVDELVLPVNAKGLYDKDEFVAYGPENPIWSYSAPEKPSFLSPLISSTQRLPNGNTFICSGIQRILFEVTPDNEIVWQFKHTAPGMGPRAVPSVLVPGFFNRMLAITDDQRIAIFQLQKEVDTKLFWLLTDEQWKTLLEPPPHPINGSSGGEQGPVAPGAPGRNPQAQFRPRRIGEVIPASVIEDLALSESQLNELILIQQHVDEELDSLWRDDQQAIVDRMKQAAGPGLGSASPVASRPSTGASPSVRPNPARESPDGGKPKPPATGKDPRGPIKPPGGGLGGIFRSYRYGRDYPGLAGRDLKPGKKLVEAAQAAPLGPAKRPNVKNE